MWYRVPYLYPVVVLIGVVAVLSVGFERALSAPEGPSQGTPPKVLLFRGVRTPVAITEAARAALAPPPVSTQMKLKLLGGSSPGAPGSATRTYVHLTTRQPYVENRGYLLFETAHAVYAYPTQATAFFQPPTSPHYVPSVDFRIRPEAGGHRYLLDFSVSTPTLLRDAPRIRTFRVSHGRSFQEFGVEPEAQHLLVLFDAEGAYEYSFRVTCTTGVPWYFYSVEATTLS